MDCVFGKPTDGKQALPRETTSARCPAEIPSLGLFQPIRIPNVWRVPQMILEKQK
jgi:hypothetical protein